MSWTSDGLTHRDRLPVQSGRAQLGDTVTLTGRVVAVTDHEGGRQTAEVEFADASGEPGGAS